ncbi:MAG TPA: MscL family protein [Nocardioides sp.]|jgi:large conductance mechanosensitive channel|nr:MscL family protein [Nocardioides sp.]
MGGFKAFILKGNLIEIATGLIMALAFAAVVTTFTAWLTGLMPDSASEYFSTEEQSFGAFLNAVISFLIMGTVVYFFVVVPYTKAKERFFPSSEEGTPADIALLEEIRDAIRARGGAV